MDKTTSQIELDPGNSEEYDVKAIHDTNVYTKESNSSQHLAGFYYLILRKGYPKVENTWKPALAIQYLSRLVITFHKKHLEKLTAKFPLIDSTLPMV